MNEHGSLAGAPAARERPVRLGITVGDPAGIGPEVTALALEAAPTGCTLRVYGDVDAVLRVRPLPQAVEQAPSASAVVLPGRPNPKAARGVVEAIQRAARDCLSGELDGLVTGPISKEILGRAGFPWPGHTELLEEIAGRGKAVMMLVGDGLRVVPATIHCALREVPGRLSTAELVEILSVIDKDLRGRFALPQARIAVCGLNPHAGEGGRFGDEEERIIAPAVRTAIARGVAASGPFSADTLFGRAVRGEFDAVLGMYHDQALGPLKIHAFGRAVNVTLGLPFVRTSVDHGTAFDIAGAGRADPGSMHEAIALAALLARNERAGNERARNARAQDGRAERERPGAERDFEGER